MLGWGYESVLSGIDEIPQNSDECIASLVYTRHRNFDSSHAVYGRTTASITWDAGTEGLLWGTSKITDID